MGYMEPRPLFPANQYTISEQFSGSSRSWNRLDARKSLESLRCGSFAVHESKNTDTIGARHRSFKQEHTKGKMGPTRKGTESSPQNFRLKSMNRGAHLCGILSPARLLLPC
jgi:hypothetical protein